MTANTLADKIEGLAKNATQGPCKECRGTGVAERIGGYERPCDACHGSGDERPAPTGEPVARPRKQFPILGTRGAKIDWQLVEDHGKQVNANHYQSVTQLAGRGGLSWSELHAVLHNRPWQKVDENTAITECRAIEAQYLAAFTIPDPRIAELEAKCAAMKAAGDGLADAIEVFKVKLDYPQLCKTELAKWSKANE